jgi:hypothetical protein
MKMIAPIDYNTKRPTGARRQKGPRGWRNWPRIASPTAQQSLRADHVFDTQTFRKKYRANISPYYNPWLHAGFVLVFGVTLILFLLNKLDHVSAVSG